MVVWRWWVRKLTQLVLKFKWIGCDKFPHSIAIDNRKIWCAAFQRLFVIDFDYRALNHTFAFVGHINVCECVSVRSQWRRRSSCGENMNHKTATSLTSKSIAQQQHRRWRLRRCWFWVTIPQRAQQESEIEVSDWFGAPNVHTRPFVGSPAWSPAFLLHVRRCGRHWRSLDQRMCGCPQQTMHAHVFLTVDCVFANNSSKWMYAPTGLTLCTHSHHILLATTMVIATLAAVRAAATASANTNCAKRAFSLIPSDGCVASSVAIDSQHKGGWHKSLPTYCRYLVEKYCAPQFVFSGGGLAASIESLLRFTSASASVSTSTPSLRWKTTRANLAHMRQATENTNNKCMYVCS